ncbi:MAG: glycosyltransferase family 2 protein [Cytophagaceae bacterium]|nr:glycosyltransferase family 2 protein [Cytophagaceae bacterium]
MKPIVSVICLCYNHEKFIKEALQSIIDQSYSALEIIVVDDFSKDKSKDVIRDFIKNHPSIRFIAHNSNIGNCKSFNEALKLATGKYIIDFSTDDVMAPSRIEEQVSAFERLDESYGVIFTNALLIDEKGKETETHYADTDVVPSDDIYEAVVSRYFINPPTMMIRKNVLDELGGYDESLSYEDFDFWIRSARKYKYYYLDRALTRRRILPSSHSVKFFTKGNVQIIDSTYRVIRKALWLNQNEKENEALVKRIKYEMRSSFYLGSFRYAKKYFSLLKDLKDDDLLSTCIFYFSRLRIHVYPFYKLYLKFKK